MVIKKIIGILEEIEHREISADVYKRQVLGRYPVIPGHEFSGIVEKVGKCVTHFKPGDRVTADNGIPCRKCYHCQRGEFAFCEDYQAIGHSVNGAMAELVVVNESHVYAIPDTVSFKAAALTELVGCKMCIRDRAWAAQWSSRCSATP